ELFDVAIRRHTSGVPERRSRSGATFNAMEGRTRAERANAHCDGGHATTREILMSMNIARRMHIAMMRAALLIVSNDDLEEQLPRLFNWSARRPMTTMVRRIRPMDPDGANSSASIQQMAI